MSRVLASVDLKVVRELGRWLLFEVTGAAKVLHHFAVQTTDAHGAGWHVFDTDPTKTVSRRRSLPRGDDLPPAHRRTDDLAKPGYPDRKRGDVQVKWVSDNGVIHYTCAVIGNNID